VAAEVTFTYRLTGTGWADADVRVGEASAHASASYLGDALGELLDAVLAVAEGAATARASWDEEPGEYRWLLDLDGTELRVRLLDFREWRGVVESPDEEGEVLFDQRCDLNEFGAAVVAAARGVIDEYGIDGYREKWVEHDFPLEQLTRLEALLGERSRA
jgi:hypothetical protein